MIEQQTIADRLLTLKEVREHCRIGRTTLWRWINERGLTTVDVGGIVRVRRSQLEEFLKRHESGTPRRENI